MSTAIIIPAYNVSTKIDQLLFALLPHRQHTIFIDDGSTDDTFEKISNMDFFVLRSTDNCGIADAIFKGLTYAEGAGYSKAVLMDSDGQHSPKHLIEFISYLNDYDFVFGNRFHKSAFSPSTKLNANIFAATVVNEIFNTKFTDIACGYKAFRITKRIIEAVRKSNGYELVFELFLLALIQKRTIKFIDIEAIYPLDEFLGTRPTEILAFINVLGRYFSDYGEVREKLLSIKESIDKCNDFICISGGMQFYAYFLKEKNAYIFQADPKSIHLYLRDEM